MEPCKQGIGCHFCISFLQALEARLDRLREAREVAKKEEDLTLELIGQFKKGA